MNAIHEHLQSWIFGFSSPAEHCEKLIAPNKMVVADIPFPNAYVPAGDGQSQSFLTCAQGLRLALLDDRNGCCLRDRFNQLPMHSSRTAWCSEVESERTQHAILLIKNGHGPRGA